MSSEAPFISRRSVQKALDSMVHGGQSDQPNPLENLILVENILNDPTLPSIEAAPTFALYRLLVDLIQPIRQAAHLQAPELTGWTLLYYRYVRTDVNITSHDLLEIISVDTRTLRRYQANAVKRLANVISLQEWAERQEKQKRHLYSKLPISIKDRIWGRDKLLTHAYSLIAYNSPAHLLITGAEGIGKTSFVQAFVQRLIDDGAVDQLVWLTQPNSPDFVRSHLKQALLNESKISLEEYCLPNRLVVVLDDIDLLSDTIEADNLFGDLNNALVLVTNRTYRQFRPHFSHIVLPELDKDSVTSIVAAARPSLLDEQIYLSAFVERLREMVGGNPLAVKLAAKNLSNVDLQYPLFAEDHNTVIHQLLLSSFNTISRSAQTMLLMFALVPAKSVALSDLSALWPDSIITDSEMIALLSCGLIASHPDEAGHSLPDISRRFARWLYSDSMIVRSTVEVLIDSLTQLTPDFLPLDIVEHILAQEWLNIGLGHREILAEFGVSSGISYGHYVQWSSILENIVSLSQNTNLRLSYATCLRQLSKFSEAETLFHEIVDHCGRTGAFEEQGRGMLELGILFRQQGLYEQALAMIEHAKMTLTTQNTPELLQRIDIEIAQTLLDSGEIDLLKAITADLSTYTANNLKAMILLSEILLSLKDFAGAKLYAERAAGHAQGANLGRVYATLGRIAAEQKDFENAHDWFELAVSLLEDQNDLYGLARAKSNLAATMIQQHQYAEDAEVLLFQAQTTQKVLIDRVGLIYTEHNIEALNRTKWIDET